MRALVKEMLINLMISATARIDGLDPKEARPVPHTNATSEPPRRTNR